jgi:hypothetical protein
MPVLPAMAGSAEAHDKARVCIGSGVGARNEMVGLFYRIIAVAIFLENAIAIAEYHDLARPVLNIVFDESGVACSLLR